MKPTDLEPEFGVCPECGADMKKVNKKWICKNCGHEEKIE